MSKWYDSMVYTKKSCLGIMNWFGNLRWYVKENDEPGLYNFECISALEDDTHSKSKNKRFTARLYDVQFEMKGDEIFEYGADFIKTDSFGIIMPFYHYGCFIEGKDVNISSCGKITVSDNVALIEHEGYYICFKSSVNFMVYENGFCGKNASIAVSFNTDFQKAKIDCDWLFENKNIEIEKSKEFWEKYLDSCPTVRYENDYNYYNDSSGRKYFFDKEDIVLRQLWHWWCLLINVNEIEFNKNSLYIAPDKTNWKGTWSNDGLQCMSALALTNQKELSKRLIISYLKSSVNNEGIFSWYTHADGLGCYGLDGDVGKLSHGAPYFPHTVEYYIRNTGDGSILDEVAGTMTVYEKLKKYIYVLTDKRFNQKYGMIEWANLWETGWDDKGGCFFEYASLEDWIKMMSQGTDKEINDFYAQNQRPVIPIVEQVITLWSLNAGASLADRKKDSEFRMYCKQKADIIRKNLSKECWSEETGFYHDIDVKKNKLSEAKSADAFYWLYFENDKIRRNRIVEHLFDPNEFNCYQIPMLSRDSNGFNEHGYWSGGHWPREMSIIGMGLKESGYYDKAKEVVLRAIMISDGCVIPEVINPISGKPNTKITKMACSIMLVLALLHIEEKVKWTEEG